MDSTINQVTEPVSQAVEATVATTTDIAESASSFSLSTFSTPIIYGILAVFLAVYGPKLKPNLPESVKNLLNNNLFRFVILLIIMYISYKDIQLSLIISLAFLLLLSIANCQEVKEKYFNYKREEFQNLQQSINNFYNVEGFEDSTSEIDKLAKKIIDDEKYIETKEYKDKLAKMSESDKKDLANKLSKNRDSKNLAKMSESDKKEEQHTKNEKKDDIKHEMNTDDKTEHKKDTTVGDAVGNLINVLSGSNKDKQEKFESFEHFQAESNIKKMEEYEDYLQQTVDSYKFNYA